MMNLFTENDEFGIKNDEFQVVVWFHRAAEQLDDAVTAAVAKFPSHSGKCTPEEEAEWRSAPAFGRSLAEAKLTALEGYAKL